MPTSPESTVSSDLDVKVGDVQIQGGFPELGPSNDISARGLVGRRVSVSFIYKFAKGLEEIYAKAGYVFVRVTVPPQNLVDNGRLVFVVVDGYIESLDLAEIPEAVRDVVADRVLPLVGKRHLRKQEIERCLLLAGDVPGLTLKSTLARGSNKGGLKLVLSGEHRTVTGSIGIDNRNRSTAGTWQLRGSIAINSAFDEGEQIYTTVGAGSELRSAFENTSPLVLYGAGLILPIGTEGVTVNPEFIRSKSTTPVVAGAPATAGKFDRLSLRLRYPVIRTKSENLNVGMAIEHVTQDIKAPDFNATISSDRYAVVRFEPDYELALANAAVLRGALKISQGVAGRDGADAAISNVPMSRTGASPTFTKLNIAGRYSQPLPENLRLDLIGTGQISMGKPLFQSEQFALDGSDGVSSFAAGSFNSDTGAVLRSEISRLFEFKAQTKYGVRPAFFSPYVFGATGRGWLYSTTGVEQAVITASAVGIGLRGGVDPVGREPGLNLNLEIGRQFTDALNERQGWRANFIATVAF